MGVGVAEIVNGLLIAGTVSMTITIPFMIQKDYEAKEPSQDLPDAYFYMFMVLGTLIIGAAGILLINAVTGNYAPAIAYLIIAIGLTIFMSIVIWEYEDNMEEMYLVAPSLVLIATAIGFASVRLYDPKKAKVVTKYSGEYEQLEGKYKQLEEEYKNNSYKLGEVEKQNNKFREIVKPLSLSRPPPLPQRPGEQTFMDPLEL